MSAPSSATITSSSSPSPATSPAAASDSFWIFGYGSLTWKPIPTIAFEESRVGYILGFDRRFYQGSTDHRGTAAFPGRVVTLLPRDAQADDEPCWGVAYRYSNANRKRIMTYLDHREKDGYSRAVVPVHVTDLSVDDVRAGRVGRDAKRVSGQVEALLFTATTENESYAGEAPVEELAEVIVKAEGESGPNHVYLIELARFLRAAQINDPHVFALEKAVVALMDDQ